jgi:hypothetical protein
VTAEEAWSPTSDPASPQSPKHASPEFVFPISPQSTHSTAIISPVSETGPPPYSQQTSIESTPLKELAKKFGVALHPGLPVIEAKDHPPSYLRADSKQSAEKLLETRRTSDPEYKAPSGLSKLTKSKAKIAEFSYKEINRALTAAVNENSPLDLIEALLEMGGDVDVSRRASTNTWKKLTSKDQGDQKSEVLQTAARQGSTRKRSRNCFSARGIHLAKAVSRQALSSL